MFKFKKKKKWPLMGPIGVDSLAEVGHRLKWLEKDLIKHGMGIAQDSLDVVPQGNKYVDILLHVVLFKNPVKDVIPKQKVEELKIEALQNTVADLTAQIEAVKKAKLKYDEAENKATIDAFGPEYELFSALEEILYGDYSKE